ncbi:hypothetical protein Tco_1241903, partial [Tanacetum coccineum]
VAIVASILNMLSWASSNYRESSTAARTDVAAFAGDLKLADAILQLSDTFSYPFLA